MGSNSNGEFGFEQSSGISPPASNFPICSGFLVSHSEASAGIAAAGSTDSCLKAASCSPLEMIEPFSACWDCLVPMNGHAGFRGKMSSNGHQEQLYQLNMTPRINLAGYHSNVRLVGSAPSFSCLLNGRYPDNMSNYSLLDSTTISTVAPNNHHLSSPNQGIRIDQSAANTSSRTLVYIKEFEGIDQGIADQEVEQNGESRIVSSPLDTRKRKRMPDGIASDLNQDFDHAQVVCFLVLAFLRFIFSWFLQILKFFVIGSQRNLLFCCPWWRNESDQSKDASHLSNDSMKMKKEEDASDSPTKLNVRQNKDQNQNAEAQKEEYIHVRARRGQATNSHSLAERVRREKISERMRFLQDLVPGCNKVTGKAVMLDEIINYVLSLQCQVEFLSMKLATVNPDFNVGDIVLKNIFSSEGRSSAVLGFAPNVNPSCHTVSGYPLESIEPGTEAVHDIKNFGDTLRSMNPQFDQMEQVPNAWDNELQNVVQMGFVSPANIRIPPKDGNLKVDN